LPPAMAPRKGETAAEKSVRNAQKCQIFARKATYEATHACMRAQDSNVYRIHEFCVQSGMIQGDQPSAVAKTEAPSQLAMMDRSNSSLGAEQPEARGGSGSGAAEPTTLFLSDAEKARGVAGEVSLDAMVNYGSCYHWGLLPVSTRELLLRACVPPIFAVVVVKAMCVRGARKKTRPCLLLIWST